MGKDWLYWVLGGKGKFSGKRRKVKLDEAASSAGCMCAVFQIFDLQNHLDLPLNHQEHEGIPGSCHLQHEQAISSSKYGTLSLIFFQNICIMYVSWLAIKIKKTRFKRF